MVFKAADLPARWEGLAVCVWIAITQLLLLQWIRQRTTDWLTFLLVSALLISIPVLLHVIYRTWIAFSLEYWVDRNAVTVRWADVRQTIPLAEVSAIAEAEMIDAETGADAALDLDLEGETAAALTTQEAAVARGPSASPAALALRRARRVERSARFWADWPAHFVRPRLADGVALLASRPVRDCLLLETAQGTFALAPNTPAAFIDAVHTRARMGAVTNVELGMERRFDPARLFVSDRIGLTLVILGLLGGILLFGMLMVRFPGLPDVMAVRYNADGTPDLVREKQGLFLLPAIGLMAWVVNGIWGALLALRRQKAGSYLLWGGTLMVQICAFFALVALIGWR